MIHNMMDLKSYYDRQLTKTDLIVQESVGIQRMLIKLFLKIPLVREYHICARFSTSARFYRGDNENS